VTPSARVSSTPIQRAIQLVLGIYTVAARSLTPAERDVLRDVIACRLAADWLEESGVLDERERAA
jgi:hypothetical protein